MNLVQALLQVPAVVEMILQPGQPARPSCLPLGPALLHIQTKIPTMDASMRLPRQSLQGLEILYRTVATHRVESQSRLELTPINSRLEHRHRPLHLQRPVRAFIQAVCNRLPALVLHLYEPMFLVPPVDHVHQDGLLRGRPDHHSRLEMPRQDHQVMIAAQGGTIQIIFVPLTTF